MIFKYTAEIPDGGKERGVIAAKSEEEAQKLLAERERTLLKIQAVNSSVNDSPHCGITTRSEREKMICRFFISSSQLETALDQLSVMLDAGVPIFTAIQTVAAQSNTLLSRALFCVANNIKTGKSFSDSLHQDMPFLGATIIGMISAGELNGEIPQMCEASVNLLERTRKLKGKVIQAMAYPIVVIFIAIGIVIFLMTSVIPKIMKFLGNRSAGLPPITQALIDVTEFLETQWPYFVVFPVALVVIVILLRKNVDTAVYVDYVALRLPVVGKVLRASGNMLWCRTLGLLLQSGISIIPALEFTAGTISNHFYKMELLQMKNIISQGHPLSTALRVSELKPFIPMADAMLVISENTGRVDTGLLKISDTEDNDLEKRIAFLAKMIEPALFVVVGGIVGFVYIAFFMGLMAASTGK